MCMILCISQYIQVLLNSLISQTLSSFSYTLSAFYRMLQLHLLPQMTAGFLFGFSGVPTKVSSELGETKTGILHQSFK